MARRIKDPSRVGDSQFGHKGSRVVRLDGQKAHLSWETELVFKHEG